MVLCRHQGSRMKWKGWERIPLRISDNAGNSATREVIAIAPLIISASRSTDIPAFYGDWFMARLAAGYLKWKSPFGGTSVYISLSKARVFIFWSKNPAPFFHHLNTLDRLGYRYCFLFTLNDYDDEGLEPGVPRVEKRINAFIRLSRKIGKGRVTWRFDPLVLSDRITVTDLLEKIRSIGDRIHLYTERLVFSFVEIAKYAKVRRSLQRQGFSGIREFCDDEITEFCEGLAILNKKWGLTITACGERRDLSDYGIGRGQCISYDMMTQEFRDDRKLMEFLHPASLKTLSGSTAVADPSRWLKDPGQRNTCHCIVSKDIGQYSTCMHLCAYCYANTSPADVNRRYVRYRTDAESGIFHDVITE
jgi:hypothetical protein